MYLQCQWYFARSRVTYLDLWQAQTTPSRSPPQTETSEEADPIRIGPSGRPETEDEYQARMAHNCYKRFSTSLKRQLSALVF